MIWRERRCGRAFESPFDSYGYGFLSYRLQSPRQ